MAQKIGLVAELDLSKFTKAVTSYISSVHKMQQANTALAGSAGLAFRSMQNSIVNSTSLASAAMATLISTAGRLKSQLGSTFNTGHITRQLATLNTSINQTVANLNRLSSTRVNLGGIGGGGRGGGGIGGMLGGLGGAATSVLGSITGVIGGIAGGITRTLGSAIAGAVGGAFSILTRTITGILGSLTRTVFGIFQNMVRGIVGLITGAIGSAFSLLANTITGIVSGIARTVVGIFQGMVRSVISVVGGIVRGIANVFSSLVSTVMGVIGGLVSGITSAFTAAFSVVGNLIRGVLGAFGSLVKSVTSIVTSLASSVFNIFTSLARSVVGVITEMVRTVFNLISNLVKSVSQALMSMASSILNAYRDLGTQLTRIITVATAAVVGAVVYAGKQLADWTIDGIQSAADFEQSLADIASVLRATRDEVGPLADKIDELALDPDLVVSTENAAEVIEQLARNGVTMTQILNGAAEASILLANATGTGTDSFAKAADIATMAMQMFNIEASEFTRIADVSQGVVNNSRIELDDWALALGNGGAAAAALSVSLEDFATAIAGTVNLYHTARQAGTGLNNFLQRLVPLTDESADQMRELGLFTGLTEEEFNSIRDEIAKTEQTIADLDPRLVHYDELVAAHTEHVEDLKKQMVAGNNAFFDANGNLKSLAEVSEILRNATKDLSDEEQVETFRRIFGNDALETAIGLANLGADAFNKLQKEIVISGSSAEAAAVRTATLAARWRNLQDIWLAIQRKSGAGFNAMLLTLVNRMTALTNQNQDRIIAFFGRMAELISRVVEAAMPWVERQLPMLIDNLEALANWLVELVLGGGRAQEWFNKMSPTLRTFVEKVISVAKGVRNFAREVIDFGKTVMVALRPFVNFVKENVELKDVLIAAAGAIAFSIVPGFLRMISIAGLAVKAVSAIRHAWETDWMGIRSFFEQTWPKIRGPLIDFVNNLLTGKWGDAWKQMVQFVHNALTDLEAAVPPFFKTFVNLLSDILGGDWRGAWENIVTIAKNSFELIKGFLRDLEHPVSDFITDVLEGNWPKVWKKIVETAQGAFVLIKQMLRDLETPFTDFIVDVLEGSWGEVWRKITVATQVALNKVADILYSFDMPFTDFLGNVLTGKWDVAWEQMKSTAQFAYQWVIDQLYGLDMPFTDFLGNVLTGKWSEAWDQIKTVVKTAYTWVVDQLYSLEMPFTTFLANVLTGKWSVAWDQIKSFAKDAYNWVIDQLYALEMPFTNFLANILTGKWSEAWRQVKTVVTTVLEEIKDYLPDWGDALVSALEAVLEGRWADAWQEARRGATLVLDEIKDYTPEWGDMFITAIQDIINGEWVKAWNDARSGAVLALGELKNLTPDWMDPFITSVQQIISGDWVGAWDTARQGVINALGLLKESAPTWLTPFITMTQQMLAGDWNGAWTTAKQIALDALEPIKTWVGQQGQEVYNWFQTNMPNATLATETGFKDVKDAWDKFVEAATESDTQISLDNLAAVVITGLTKAVEALLLAATAIVQFLNGDWKEGWKTAGEALSTFNELPAVNAVTTWFGKTFPDAATQFEAHMPGIQSAWEPVATNWSSTWTAISSWWDTSVVPFFNRTLVSISDYFGTSITQIGLFLQGIEALITGPGSFQDRLAAADLIFQKITLAEKEFWLREIERSSVVVKTMADTAGTNINSGFNDGIKKGAGTDEAGNPIPEGLVFWTAGIQGAMTKLQSDIYTRAKVIGEQTNYGYVAGLGDPSQPIVSGLNAWTQLAIDTAEQGLEIKSPSGKFKEIAKQTQEGFKIGVQDNMHLAVDMVGAMKDAMLNKMREAVESAKGIVQQMVSSMASGVDQNALASVGTQLGQGLVNGLNSQLASVQAASSALVTAAATGVETTAQIASPSKLFFKLGSFMRQGLEMGWGDASSFKDQIIGTIKQTTGQQIAQAAAPRISTSASYSTVNSPVTVNNYIYTEMDKAELEYTMQNMLNRAGLGLT